MSDTDLNDSLGLFEQIDSAPSVKSYGSDVLLASISNQSKSDASSDPASIESATKPIEAGTTSEIAIEESPKVVNEVSPKSVEDESFSAPPSTGSEGLSINKLVQDQDQLGSFSPGSGKLATVSLNLNSVTIDHKLLEGEPRLKSVLENIRSCLEAGQGKRIEVSFLRDNDELEQFHDATDDLVAGAEEQQARDNSPWSKNTATGKKDEAALGDEMSRREEDIVKEEGREARILDQYPDDPLNSLDHLTSELERRFNELKLYENELADKDRKIKKLQVQKSRLHKQMHQIAIKLDRRRAHLAMLTRVLTKRKHARRYIQFQNRRWYVN